MTVAIHLSAKTNPFANKCLSITFASVAMCVRVYGRNQWCVRMYGWTMIVVSV